MSRSSSSGGRPGGAAGRCRPPRGGGGAAAPRAPRRRAATGGRPADARRRVLIPSSAHGTNPASATLCGYEVTEVAVDARGLLTAAAVAAATDESVAALMITNPNTLGLFEREIEGITAAVHACGGLVYLDGANLNAIMGIAKPAHMGVDVMQFNLHKTFSTPHGGGGPGAGPVARRGRLVDYLPVPRLVRRDGALAWTGDAPPRVGRPPAV